MPKKIKHAIAVDGELMLEQLELNPGDKARMLLYADWLEDMAREDEAFAWRWAAHRGCWPCTNSLLYYWANAANCYPSSQASGRLPPSVYVTLGSRLGQHRKDLDASFRVLATALAIVRKVLSFDDKA